MALIHEKMAQIMSDVPAIGKKSKNVQQGFRFRGIDDLMNAFYPVLVKNQVFIVPEVLEHKTEDFSTKSGSMMHRAIAKVRYTFMAVDGSSISAVSVGEGMDSGDKASSKAMAIAMKYAIFQSLCIPTDEMKYEDPDFITPKEHHKEGTICEGCGNPILPITKNGEVIMEPEEISKKSFDKYGKRLCYSCSCAEAKK